MRFQQSYYNSYSYFESVARAKKNGIVGDYDNDKLGPNDNIPAIK
ncbi:S-layer homology domain-containing protein [Clostridium sp.]